jgi:hypothetical protein
MLALATTTAGAADNTSVNAAQRRCGLDIRRYRRINLLVRTSKKAQSDIVRPAGNPIVARM